MKAIGATQFEIINKVLLVGAICVLLYTTLHYFRFEKDWEYHSDDNSSATTDFRFSNNENLKVLDLNVYQQTIASKRLFRPLVKKVQQKEQVITIDDLSRDIVVIGVVTQDKPEAIVKDRRTRQTVFVKEGGMIGKLKVESVTDQGIVVSYNNTKKEFTDSIKQQKI